ncbi:MAG: hypothetical protein LBP80_05115, partial [Treponema sp.]|nr:hypothetical protein [Treponema sp.]
ILLGSDDTERRQEPIYKLLDSCIEQGKKEGIFDRNIDTETVVHLLLSQPAIIMGRAARGRKGALEHFNANHAAALEIKRSFEIILRGIVRGKVDRKLLVLPEPEEKNVSCNKDKEF